MTKEDYKELCAATYGMASHFFRKKDCGYATYELFLRSFNTYDFFGQEAISVKKSISNTDPICERYQRIIAKITDVNPGRRIYVITF